MAGGCHLDRKIDELSGLAGFNLMNLQVEYALGRRTMSYMYEGARMPKPFQGHGPCRLVRKLARSLAAEAHLPCPRTVRRPADHYAAGTLGTMLGAGFELMDFRRHGHTTSWSAV